jgi:hypothetical protein
VKPETTTYYVFDVLIEDVFGCPMRDRVWVAGDNQETARLTALATWPKIRTIEFLKSVEDHS